MFGLSKPLSLTQTFREVTRHLSLKFSREFRSLDRLKSEFTLTKVRL